MGLFDRKREEPEPAPKPVLAPQPVSQSEAQASAPQSSLKSLPAPPNEFGIQKAMELMRKLPADNIPLVVQVVRTTLESTNVDVGSIIGDAREKCARIEVRIQGLREEITDFEEEISARRQEITALEADEEETRTVQERLEMAMDDGLFHSDSSGTNGMSGGSALERAIMEDPMPKPPY